MNWLENSAYWIAEKLSPVPGWLRKWADHHFARRMAGNPDWTALSIYAVAVAALGLGVWWGV